MWPGARRWTSPANVAETLVVQEAAPEHIGPGGDGNDVPPMGGAGGGPGDEPAPNAEAVPVAPQPGAGVPVPPMSAAQIMQQLQQIGQVSGVLEYLVALEAAGLEGVDLDALEQLIVDKAATIGE